jgi:sensor histidine kinase regulating citrate/malate metabolism
MNDDIKLQVFQRSFSTKGKNRGTGTYESKLLVSRYLKGEISFTSNKDGTTFQIRLPLSCD